jgi:hypothetical protein
MELSVEAFMKWTSFYTLNLKTRIARVINSNECVKKIKELKEFTLRK